MVRRIKFKNELILHRLTQKHLKELFGLKCIASEMQHNRLRPDNLAFDEKSNSFAIIEYKNRLDANVLNQAKGYYHLLLEDPEKFIGRHDEDADINPKKTRVLIIGPEFSERQIGEVESPFELWQVTLYDNHVVEYKRLKTGETITLKVTEEDLKLTEEDLLKNRQNDICELYFTLKDRVKTEFDDAEFKILVGAFSFKLNNRLICNVNFLKKSFNVYFFAEELSDKKDKLRDISDISTGGKANYELKINSKSDIDYFIELFRQVYDEKSLL